MLTDPRVKAELNLAGIKIIKGRYKVESNIQKRPKIKKNAKYYQLAENYYIYSPLFEILYTAFEFYIF